MANYKESAVSGTSWVRCKSITITNPLQAVDIINPPKAYFYEELAINSGSIIAKMDVNSIIQCSKVFDPSGVIPIRNPETNELTGTSVSHMELYTILYSLYLQTAEERDAAQL